MGGGRIWAASALESGVAKTGVRWLRPRAGRDAPAVFASLAGLEFHIFDAGASATTRWWPSSMSSFIFKETGVAVSEENEVPSGTFDADDKVSRTCPTLDTHQSRVGVGGVNEAL